MTFVDIPFPERISFGAQSDPSWMTELTGTTAGFETTNQNWTQARHRYDVSLAIRTATDYKLVRAHFHQVRGRAKSFPFKDPLDFTVSASEGVPSALGASWHMAKRYGSGADAYDRLITRPVSGTVIVYRTRSGTTTNATANATINHTTGSVVMASHVSGDTYTWAGSFMVPVRYDVDQLPGVIANRQGGATGELLVECASIPLVEVRE